MRFCPKLCFLLCFAAIFMCGESFAFAQSYQGGCPIYSASVGVDVSVRADEIRIDNTKTVRELESEDINTSIATHRRGEYQVSGLTKGNISVEREVSFKTSTDSRTGVGCIWPEKVTVIVHLIDTVYIANKYTPGTCEFRETYNHEIKHVNVDRSVLNKYIPFLKSRVEMAANMLGVRGPLSLSQIKEQKYAMSENIRSVIDEVVNQLQSERTAAQNSVDTASEYQRVSRACKSF